MSTALMRGVMVLSVLSVACSGGMGANAAQTNILLEGAGLEKLRIGEATVADATSYLGINTIVWMDALDSGQGDIATPQLLRLAFRSPESGEGPPVLYAVRAELAAPIYDGETPKGIGYYTGKTSKGIGFLDSLESVNAVYGPSDAEEIRMFDRVHYFADEGVIIATKQPAQIDPRDYAAARAALGKQPHDGPASVVTGIMVVPPFQVIEAPRTLNAGQRVVTSSAQTTLRVAVF